MLVIKGGGKCQKLGLMHNLEVQLCLSQMILVRQNEIRKDTKLNFSSSCCNACHYILKC